MNLHFGAPSTDVIRMIYRMGKYRMLAAMAAVGLVLAAVPAFARPLDSNCSKIEGSAIGNEGVSVTAEGVTVTFSGWQTKAGEAKEFVGFDYTSEGGSVSSFSVKAGRNVHSSYAGGTSGTWVLPASDGKAVSHVVVCTSTGTSAVD